MKLRKKYTLVERAGNWSHTWSVEGRDGAICLSVTDQKENTYGGIEIHSRTPLDDRPPDHRHCEFTGEQCWHDGSSLYVEENILPIFDSDQLDHKFFFDECEHWYKRRFNNES